jgi:hypothetical protein
MSAIHIRKRINSDTITMPELRSMVGREVEFVISDEPCPLLETEETFFGLAPPEPTEEEHAREMELLREKAKADPVAAAWLLAIETDALDVEKVIRNRGMQ